MKLSPTSSPFFFHFSLSHHLLWSSNIFHSGFYFNACTKHFFFLSFRDRFLCVWFICFYAPAILAFMCTSRVESSQTFKLWKKVLSRSHSCMAAKMDWRSFHFNSNGFFCLAHSLLRCIFSCHFCIHLLLYKCNSLSKYAWWVSGETLRECELQNIVHIEWASYMHTMMMKT